MARVRISNVTYIRFNGHDVRRMWYMGHILWQYRGTRVPLRVQNPNVRLNMDNQYLDRFYLESDREWTFES